jgi:group I intron endonuclease
MKSGVYIIKNKINNKFYIGSSINIKKRFREHLSSLRNNSHHSKYLQNAFNKHKENNFTFEILEECDSEFLILREQYFIDILSPVYNMAKIAGNTLGLKRTEDTKKKLSKSHKGQIPWNKGVKATEESKIKQSKTMKGRVSGARGIKWSKKSRKKLSDSKKNVTLSEEHKQNLSKKTYEYDLQGNFIKEHNSVSSAAKSVDSLHVNLVRAMKKNKPFKNRIFKYEKPN